MKYICYIKSHCEAPDYEQEIEANSKGEAVELFYQILQGEYDRDFLYSAVEVLK
jgi:hypothetical protein